MAARSEESGRARGMGRRRSSGAAVATSGPRSRGLSSRSPVSRQGADPDAAALGALLAELGPAEAVDEGEQARLLKMAAAGDARAQDRLLRLHLRRLIRMAAGFAGRSLPAADLVQEASVAFLGAVRSFPESGRPDFEAYSAERAGQAIEAALAGEREAATEAAALLAAATAFDRAEYALASELRRPPTEAEMAERLRWLPERVESVGELVRDARRRHDEELLQYLDPDADEVLAEPAPLDA